MGAESEGLCLSDRHVGFAAGALHGSVPLQKWGNEYLEAKLGVHQVTPLPCNCMLFVPLELYGTAWWKHRRRLLMLQLVESPHSVQVCERPKDTVHTTSPGRGSVCGQEQHCGLTHYCMVVPSYCQTLSTFLCWVCDSAWCVAYMQGSCRPLCTSLNIRLKVCFMRFLF
jgi:hypothetical protein